KYLWTTVYRSTSSSPITTCKLNELIHFTVRTTGMGILRHGQLEEKPAYHPYPIYTKSSQSPAPASRTSLAPSAASDLIMCLRTQHAMGLTHTARVLVKRTSMFCRYAQNIKSMSLALRWTTFR